MGKAAHEWIEQLRDAKVIVSRGLTFYHRDSELEFNFLVSVNGERTKLNRIVQRILATSDASITFENVIGITGHGLECGEDLTALDVISFSEGVAKIDFGKLHDIKSNTALIRVRTNASDALKRLLVFRKIEKIPQYTGTKTESRIEVALDYASLWSKTFDQCVVRDIEFISTLNVDLETILDEIPRKQARRIAKAAEQAVRGNADAILFLRIMAKSFLSFESDEMISRLRHLVSVEPKNFVLKEIHPAMQYVEMPNTGYPVLLPGRIRVRVGCVLEGNQVVACGRLVVDIEKFTEIMHEIVQDIHVKTLKLRF